MEKGGIHPVDKDFPGHQKYSDIGKNVLFAKAKTDKQAEKLAKKLSKK